MRKVFLACFLGLLLSGCGKKEEAMKMEHHKTMAMACTYECCTGDPKCKDVACWNKAMEMCKHAVCPMM